MTSKDVEWLGLEYKRILFRVIQGINRQDAFLIPNSKIICILTQTRC